MKEIEILFTHIFIGIFLSSIQCLYLKKPNLSKGNLQTKYPVSLSSISIYYGFSI